VVSAGVSVDEETSVAGVGGGWQSEGMECRKEAKGVGEKGEEEGQLVDYQRSNRESEERTLRGALDHREDGEEGEEKDGEGEAHGGCREVVSGLKCSCERKGLASSSMSVGGRKAHLFDVKLTEEEERERHECCRLRPAQIAAPRSSPSSQ
jgi:hypothetical protein